MTENILSTVDQAGKKWAVVWDHQQECGRQQQFGKPEKSACEFGKGESML